MPSLVTNREMKMEYRIKGQLGDIARTAHLYDVYIRIDGKEHIIEVFANNRNQAARMAEKAGYVVDSVNMVG